MEPKKKDNRPLIFVFIALAAFIILLDFNIAEIQYGNQGMNFLSALPLALERMGTNPFAVSHALKAGTLAQTILVSMAILGIAVLYFYGDAQSKEHADPNTAQGSAKWDTHPEEYTKKHQIKGHPEKSIILGKDLGLGMKPGDSENVCILGMTGTGKSFGVIKPNLMQMNSSFCVTDPSGDICSSDAKLLMDNGYDVKMFSISNMASSNCYNPFDYVYDEEGGIDETRVSTMVTMFIQNAAELANGGKAGGDKFWDQASKALLTACAMYLLEFMPPEYRNFYNMLRLVQMGKVSETNSDADTKLDRMFSAARKIRPDSHCFSSYDTFKLAPARTANSILISAAVDMNMFNQTLVRNMTTTDYKVKSRNLAGQIVEYAKDENGKLIRTSQNLDLNTIGDKKTAIFINIPQTNATYNFLVSMLYSQMFDSLYGRAEKICPNKWMVVGSDGNPVKTMLDSEDDAKKARELYLHAYIIKALENGKPAYFIANENAGKKFTLPGYPVGYMERVYSSEVGKKIIHSFENSTIVRQKNRLPWHVQCLLDEFANIGSIPEFPQKLATMRKYEISCMIVLQSKSQLQNRYDKLWPDIIANCRAMIFLGSTDTDTCKLISDRIGKHTIRIQNSSISQSGRGGSSSKNYGLTGRELMMPDEVSRIELTKSIVLVDGHNFFISKYKASDHPQWKNTGDVDPNQRISVTEFTECSEKLTSDSGDQDAMIKFIENALEKHNAEVQKINNAKNLGDAVNPTPKNGPLTQEERERNKDAAANTKTPRKEYKTKGKKTDAAEKAEKEAAERNKKLNETFSEAPAKKHLNPQDYV